MRTNATVVALAVLAAALAGQPCPGQQSADPPTTQPADRLGPFFYLHPMPQKVTPVEAALPVAGVSIFVPASADEKVLAIANCLARRWKLYFRVETAVRAEGQARGRLDASAVAAGLKNDAADLRDMAAELIASCVPAAGRGPVYRGLDAPASFAACARALAVAQDRSQADRLVAALADPELSADARTAAAFAIGRLGLKQAAPALLKALAEEKDAKLLGEAAWTLVLLKAPDIDGPIAKLLDSADASLRRRAAVCLVTIRSPLSQRVADWMTSADRTDMQIGLWAARKTLPKREAHALARAAMPRQPDASARKALKEYVEPAPRTD